MYLKKYKKIELTNKENEQLLTCFETISKKVFSQEKFFVHRDYHSRNLMNQKSNNPGILDFQDALVGPVTYDLVSLLKDAYIEWDEEIVLDHAVRYWEKANANKFITNLEFSTFYKDFECMGIQRHLKILGILQTSVVIGSKFSKSISPLSANAFYIAISVSSFCFLLMGFPLGK